ncbi:SDR family oxidoreductase [Nonomuraea sp. MG754425]|uniref:SDR family NAD(P)-dependent oxidoreductase n=1 Tax=Nonomuraea sp. MG754425 TaxID=2570319 RepID=UPI001F448B48|nr:SDR family NAD(P)-dependent oxidoreductase [Nonomuraea sp. MG754425]MCF6474743.1 SDR family oxidoreductase [Nonomuraea sp. MG754425]
MTLTGSELAGQDTVVVGGTGNVGVFLVDAFVRAGARVLVPSRSRDKIDRLLTRLGPDKARHVVGLIGDIGSAGSAAALQSQVQDEAGTLRAVAAAPAGWHQTHSMLRAGFDDFKAVIENSLFPHYLAAQTFLPLLDSGGSYTSINGPVGFLGPPQPGIGPMAVVSIAQNKLTQAFAVETGGTPRVNDVVMMAFIGPNGTRPGSHLSGEQVGDYVTALASPAGATMHSQTLHLRDPRQVEAALAGDFTSPA